MIADLSWWLRRILGLQREQWLSPPALERLQWGRFKRVLEHAYTTTAFYRKRLDDAGLTPGDVRDRSDLGLIPVTRREDLRRAEELLSTVYRERGLKRSTTSGSTGRRTTTYFDGDAWIMGKHLLKLRARLACGLRPWDRIALLQEAVAPDGSLLRRLARLRSFSVLSPLDELVPRLLDFGPTALYGFPGHLLRLGAAGGGRIAPRIIFTSGEMLDGRTRRDLERSFGAEVYDVYGCTEAKEIAWQCPERGAHHINSDWLLVECEQGDDVGGETGGEILVSSLYNFGMPLIRYRVGDTIRLLPGRCSCGRGLPLMTPGVGRSVDYFVLPDGREVSPYALTCAIEHIEGIRQYQLVQERRDRVLVNVVPDAAFTDSSHVRIRAALRPFLPGIEVKVKEVEKIDREAGGKYRIVLSRVTGR